MNKHTIDSEVKNPPVQLITARRSLRLSKVKIEAENSEMDEYCCNSSGDESHDSDNSDSDDENSLEPDIASFEMVVDSVESLRSFMEKFKPNDGNENGRFKKNKVHSKKRCEIDLYERLNNLLVELEPWEVKLQKAQQKALNRLKKEWEEFEDKEEVRFFDFSLSDSCFFLSFDLYCTFYSTFAYRKLMIFGDQTKKVWVKITNPALHPVQALSVVTIIPP